MQLNNKERALNVALSNADDLASELVKALKGNGFEDGINPMHQVAKQLLWAIEAMQETIQIPADSAQFAEEDDDGISDAEYFAQYDHECNAFN